MQRSSFRPIILLIALYVSACAPATRHMPATEVPKPLRPGETISSVLAPSAPAPAATMPVVPTLPAADNFAPHIALILPLQSPSFSNAAEAVQQGFLAAARSQIREFPVRVYPSSDEGKDVADIYRQALANGAIAVAGPLTRAGVNQLASQAHITVPTLALNTSEQANSSGKLYFYALLPEAEARQMARLAYAADLRDATIINTGTPLAKRLSLAFAEEWKKLGGNINAEVNYNEGDDTQILVNLPTAPWLVEPVQPPPMIVVSESGEVTTAVPKRVGPPPVAPGNVAFLAADTKQARMIRPYLNPTLPVYGTSQLYNSGADSLTNYDLNEIHFADMPWLLQPDHAAVMIYPRPPTILDTDRERLYAFGIDAYRLLRVLHNPKRNTLPLDGVTGQLQLGDSNVFQREATAAMFKYGRGLTPQALIAVEAERAAAKAAEIAARKAAAEQANAPQ